VAKPRIEAILDQQDAENATGNKDGDGEPGGRRDQTVEVKPSDYREAESAERRRGRPPAVAGGGRGPGCTAMEKEDGKGEEKVGKQTAKGEATGLDGEKGEVTGLDGARRAR
jgi:hypothetical protein